MTDQRFVHLSGLNGSLARASLSPKAVVYLAGAFVTGLAWLWLAFMAGRVTSEYGPADLGPGMSFLAWPLHILQSNLPDVEVAQWLVSLCTPQALSAITPTSFAVIFAMWLAMSIAMMFPSAAPMLRTYADIADVAKGQGKRVVPLFILALGYALSWTACAGLFALLQSLLIAGVYVDDATTPMTGAFGGLVLIAAGAYQFSALKHACLEKCRNPFSILFANWSDRTIDVARLGIQQGLFCIGCCWALMLVMFVVGTMNLAWMAFLALFTIVEKSGSGKVTSYVSGGILLAWGGILSALSIFGS